MIENLTKRQGALFAALLCEKMYPGYLLFSQMESWGDANLYKRGIKVLYDIAEGISGSLTMAQEVIDNFDRVFSDLDEFESLAASFGFDASCALEAALNFVVSSNNEQLIHCAQFALDTVDMFVQEIEDFALSGDALETAISSNEYMIRAKQWQENLLLTLASADSIDQKFIAQIRQQQVTLLPLIEIERLPK